MYFVNDYMYLKSIFKSTKSKTHKLDDKYCKPAFDKAIDYLFIRKHKDF